MVAQDQQQGFGEVKKALFKSGLQYYGATKLYKGTNESTGFKI